MKIIPIAFLMALIAAPALAQAPNRGDDTTDSTNNQTVHGVTGQQVFSQVCQACHMADGKGGSGAATVPALAKNPHLADPGYPITMVVQGRGAMPFLTDILSPTQIANVVGYVRTHFGNHYPGPVTSADVERVEGLAK